MNCPTTQGLFSDYFDGGLPQADRALLEEHLRACATCTTEFKHFTTSLNALHDTGPVETTQVFLSTVKAAAAAHLQRREGLLNPGDSQGMTVVTPRAERPAPAAVPSWVPWSMAGVLVFAFSLGLLVSGRGAPADYEELRRKVQALETLQAKPAPPVVEAPPVDVEKILAERGLVRVNGLWIPESMKKDFDAGRVYLGGKPLAREEAAKLLLKEFPPPLPPVPVPKPDPAPDPAKALEEAMAKAGYRKFNELWVPESWTHRWDAGDVLVGVDQWRKASDFKEELVREHNLVEFRGKLMTREQAEWLQSQQVVRMPDAATATNEVTRALEGLQIGPPMNHRGITVYPLLATAAANEARFLPLHAAQGPGRLELSDDRVFSVQARNPLDADVLFLAGEVLSGGRCGRVVAEDVLVARGQTARIPVFCVEPGAWRTGERFAKESGHFVAPPSLRRTLVWELGQGALWAQVAKRLDKTRAGQADLFRKHAEAIADARAYFTVLPDREPSAVGLAVAIGEALDFVEVFQDHALLTAYFDRLLAGAALDVLERPADAASKGAAFPNSVKGVKQFLESAFFWAYEAREDGYGVRKDEAWIGRARLQGGQLAHAVLFSPGAPEWDRRTPYTVPKDKMAKTLAEFETRMKPLGPSRKVAVLRDLASIASAEVTGALLRHLNETDATVRRAVIQELGASGDFRATEPLVQILTRSRGEPALFAETARALCRLGDERAVDPMLRQIDAGDIDPAKVLIQAFPELLLQVRSRDLLERAAGRLVVLYEATEGVLKGDVILDPVAKNIRPTEAKEMVDAVRTSLLQLVGLEFGSAAGCRKWWNGREERERFLKERTGK
jgi:hypothetical protein